VVSPAPVTAQVTKTSKFMLFLPLAAPSPCRAEGEGVEFACGLK
jgi:hypothetical protein